MLKQPGSRMCFVCGRENPVGFHADFFLDGDTVYTEMTPQDQHQGYPGMMHGGLVATLLDETVGRSAFLKNMWCVTAKMELRYRKAAPIGRPIRVVGWTTQARGRILEAKGEVRLDDGSVAVEANAMYVEIPEERRREVESLVY